MVAANEPVPEPVTSPVSVIVWSPVFVPDRLPTFVCSASVYAFVSELFSYAVLISASDKSRAKSILPFVSSYVIVRSVSVLEETIPPIISCTSSVVRVCCPTSCHAEVLSLYISALFKVEFHLK